MVDMVELMPSPYLLVLSISPDVPPFRARPALAGSRRPTPVYRQE